jgi:hypothetical protein
MSRKRRIMHLVRGNAIASVALFMALGGSAYAANTVFSSDIVDGEVRSADVEDNGLTAVDVRGLGSADIIDDSLTGADVSTLTGADVNDNSLSGADVSGIGGADIDADSVSGSDIDERSLSVHAMGCQSGKVQGYARIKGAAGIPTSYVDESSFIDLSNSCSDGRIEVRRESEGVYFVRFVGNPASLAVGVPNQDGATTDFSGDADNVLTIGKVSAAGIDAGAFRVDVADLPGPGATPGGRQDGKFTILLP